MTETLRTRDALRVPSGALVVYCGRNRQGEPVVLVYRPETDDWASRPMLEGQLARCQPTALPEGVRCPL